MMKKILLAIGLFTILSSAYAQQFSLPILPEKMGSLECAQVEPDVLNCCDWLLYASPEFNKPKHEECSCFLVRWLTATHKVKVIIHPDLVDESKSDLLVAYMAGWTRHALRSKGDGTLLCANVAVEETLRYYVDHKDYLGKSKKMEKLLKKQADGNLAAYVYSALAD